MKVAALTLPIVVVLLASGCGTDDGIDYGGGSLRKMPEKGPKNQCGSEDSQRCD